MKTTGPAVPKIPKSGGLKVVGHRGARNLAAENTLAAIDQGLKYGVDEIEIDVRVTKDGQVVLNHNRDCSGPSGNSLTINQATFAELVVLKPDLPTLAGAIRRINRSVPLYIEVKWGEPTEPVVSIVQSFLAEGWQTTDFLIGSKKHKTLLEMHQALPAITKIVIEPFLSVRAVWRAKKVDTKRLSMRQQWLWSGFIRAMHRRGYLLYAYTLNNPDKAKRWHTYGLTGVITDRPDLFERGR